MNMNNCHSTCHNNDTNINRSGVSYLGYPPSIVLFHGASGVFFSIVHFLRSTLLGWSFHHQPEDSMGIFWCMGSWMWLGIFPYWQATLCNRFPHGEKMNSCQGKLLMVMKQHQKPVFGGDLTCFSHTMAWIYGSEKRLLHCLTLMRGWNQNVGPLETSPIIINRA